MDPKDIYMSKPWLKFYPEGVPHEVDVPETSVPDVFDAMADRYRNKVALIFYGKKIQYGKLKELTDRFAAALHRLGRRRPVAGTLRRAYRQHRHCGAPLG